MVPRGKDNNIEAQLADLAATVKVSMDANTKQHAELKELLFANTPNSLQGQINVLEERAFGDNPTSLKSQIIDIKGKDKWVTGYIAGTFAVFGGMATLLALKWSTIIEFFRAVTK